VEYLFAIRLLVCTPTLAEGAQDVADRVVLHLRQLFNLLEGQVVHRLEVDDLESLGMRDAVVDLRVSGYHKLNYKLVLRSRALKRNIKPNKGAEGLALQASVSRNMAVSREQTAHRKGERVN